MMTQKNGRVTIFVSALLLLTIFVVAANNLAVNDVSAATPPSLGAASSFAILAHTGVSDIPTSIIKGNVGLSPTSGTGYSGLTCGEVSGTIYSVDAAGPSCRVTDPTLLTNAVHDLGNAYNGLSQACTGFSFGTGNVVLDGKTLVPGVYCADTFSLSGTLTLSGSGVWIFRTGASGGLTTTTGANVVVGDPCSVWWQIGSSATLGTGTELAGNILAGATITLATGAILNGRALAQTGAVTLDMNNVNLSCAILSASLTTITSTLPGGSITTITSTSFFLTIIPEYPWGVLLLLILMLPVYLLLKRRMCSR
jgi:hypothetical protein